MCKTHSLIRSLLAYIIPGLFINAIAQVSPDFDEMSGLAETRRLMAAVQREKSDQSVKALVETFSDKRLGPKSIGSITLLRKAISEHQITNIITPALVAVLSSGRPAARRQALLTLEGLGELGRGAESAVRLTLLNGEEHEKLLAAQALAVFKMLSSESIRLMADLVDKRSEEDCDELELCLPAKLIEALGASCNTAAAVPELFDRQLKNQNWMCRLEAARAVWRCRGATKEVIEYILEEIQSKDVVRTRKMLGILEERPELLYNSGLLERLNSLQADAEDAEVRSRVEILLRRERRNGNGIAK